MPEAQSNTTHMDRIRKLFRIKAAAEATSRKCRAIAEIGNNCWSAGSDDERLSTVILSAQLCCEYAEDELSGIQDLCDNLINSPPTYGGNPDERKHRFLELDVLVSRASFLLEELGALVCDLKDECDDLPEFKLREAAQRAKGAHREINSIEVIAAGMVGKFNDDDGQNENNDS